MRERYRLIGVGNEELVAALSGLVRRENDLMSDLLAHLAELDDRRLYLDLGFTSLFAYCTEELGLCKSSAGRRIAVARVCRKYPEAFGCVARGELQLSVLSLLGPHLNPENAAELFEACRHKSCEQVELLLAARFPKPDVREAIRRLPTRRLPTRSEVRTPHGGCARGAAPAGPAKCLQIADETDETDETDQGQRTREARSIQGTISTPRELEPLSVDRFAVRFTVDSEFRELLEDVRALASHREPGGDLVSLIKHGLQAYRRELQKERFGVGTKPRRVRRPSVDGANHASNAEGADTSRRSEAVPATDAQPAGPSPVSEVACPRGAANAMHSRHVQAEVAPREAQPARRSRHVPAAVAREVYLRDGGRCTFCSEAGRRCSTRRFLELDHVTPWAVGGEATAENLRLRCRAHNLHAARRYFGAELVRAAVASRR